MVQEELNWESLVKVTRNGQEGTSNWIGRSSTVETLLATTTSYDPSLFYPKVAKVTSI